jgi:hypothetical protein
MVAMPKRRGTPLLSGCHFFLQGVSAKIPAFSFCPRGISVLLSALRQGPWIEGWQTPPEPEGSNGSLPFLVVVP